jgi:hypothetical protein
MESVNNSPNDRFKPRAQIFGQRNSIANQTTDQYLKGKRNAFEFDCSNEGLMKLFTNFFKKSRRSMQENQVIQAYLTEMNEFVEMLKKVDDVPLSDLLQTISMHICYENVDRNRVLFKTGDSGNKFYVILNGKVDILGARNLKVAMNEFEYLTYLGNLKLYGEQELLEKVVHMNRMTFPFDADDFDKFIRRATRLVINKDGNDDPEISRFRNSLSKTSLKVLMTKEMQDLVSAITRHIHQKDLEEITADEYIKRVSPKTDDSDLSDKYVINVFEYHYILTLNTGGTFGDTALNDALAKRSATVITSEDTHFGVVYKEIYDLCIKSVHEKVKTNNLNILNNCNIFKSILRFSFSKKYYNNFINLKVERGQKILEEGSEFKCYYFTKEGEYDVYTRKTISELTGLIKSIGGDVNDYEERHLCSSNTTFSKFYNQERHKIRIFIIKGFDVLGFGDCVFDNKFIFTVELMNAKGEVFKLEKKLYNSMCYSESSILLNTKYFVEKKKHYLIKRLIQIRNTLLESIKFRVNKLVKSDNTSTKNLLRPNTALLIPKVKLSDLETNNNNLSHRKTFQKRIDNIYPEASYRQRSLYKIEKEEEEIDLTSARVNDVLNSYRKERSETPVFTTRSKKRSVSPLLITAGVKTSRKQSFFDDGGRCPSVRSTLSTNLVELKGNEKRMYFIRQKYNLKPRNKSKNSFGENSRTSGGPMNDTGSVSPFRLHRVSNDDTPGNISEVILPTKKPSYLNKVNLLFHNKAKMFKNQFLVREHLSEKMINKTKKLRKTQSACSLINKKEL